MIPIFSAQVAPSLNVALSHPRTMAQPVAVRVFGKSVAGAELRCLEVGFGSKVILVMGDIHGDEPHSGRLVRILIDECRASKNLPPDTKYLFIPVANPDGLSLGTRVNQHKVDINRNFNAKWAPKAEKQKYSPGPYPESEPETRALAALIRDLKPIRMMSIHSPLYCVNWDGAAAETWANKMAAYNGYPVKGDIGYPTPGSMGKFCIDLGIPLITLELPRTEVAPVWAENRDALRVFLGLDPLGPPKVGVVVP